MEFDDGSAQVIHVRDPGQPTAKDHQDMATHRPYRSWCKFCVMGRGANAPHRRSSAQDDLDGMPHVSMDCGFLGERDSEEQTSPVLVIGEHRHKMTWAMLVPRRGQSSPGSPREQQNSSISLDTTGSRSDATMNQGSKRWRQKSRKLAKKGVRPFRRGRQWEKASPMETSNVRWSSLPVRSGH